MSSISDKIADAYRKYLFDDSTLQDLPDRPRFVINATNVQSGALWRFSKPYMADYRVGMVPNPKVELAVVVAASSAFPPVLSPCRLTVDPATYAPPSGKPSEDLHQEPFLSDVALADGGVYDNLGLETAWKRFTTVLVSDGGGKMQAEAEPKSDWALPDVWMRHDEVGRGLDRLPHITSAAGKTACAIALHSTFVRVEHPGGHFGVALRADAGADGNSSTERKLYTPLHWRPAPFRGVVNNSDAGQVLPQHTDADLTVADGETWNITPDGRVDLHQPAVGQARRDYRGERLGYAPDGKASERGDWGPVLSVRPPEPLGPHHFVVFPDRHLSARHLQGLHVLRKKGARALTTTRFCASKPSG